jgi:hypothetical protein
MLTKLQISCFVPADVAQRFEVLTKRYGTRGKALEALMAEGDKLKIKAQISADHRDAVERRERAKNFRAQHALSAEIQILNIKRQLVEREILLEQLRRQARYSLLETTPPSPPDPVANGSADLLPPRSDSSTP